MLAALPATVTTRPVGAPPPPPEPPELDVVPPPEAVPPPFPPPPAPPVEVVVVPPEPALPVVPPVAPVLPVAPVPPVPPFVEVVLLVVAVAPSPPEPPPPPLGEVRAAAHAPSPRIASAAGFRASARSGPPARARFAGRARRAYTLPIFGTDKDIGIPVTLPIAVAHGIILGMLIIIGGGIKGPQYNPAVTIALYYTQRIPKSEMVWCLMGQASGSTLAGLLLMFFQVKGKPRTRKHIFINHKS